MSTETTAHDLEVLAELRDARQRNDEFGVGTDVNDQESPLSQCLSRLRRAGLVEVHEIAEVDLLWWKAVMPPETDL